MFFSLRVYPRFLGPAGPPSLAKLRVSMSRQFSIKARKWIYNNPNRQKVIDQINKNPNFLNQSSVSFPSRRFTWLKRIFYLTSSYCVGMGIYLGYQYYEVDNSKTENFKRQVFIPLWVGINWPSQRRLLFPKSLHYMDSNSHLQMSYDDPQFKEILRKEHVEKQVLDCLFRSGLVRETFKLPINVVETPTPTFNLWVEPHYSTLHGPLFSISKKEGKTSVHTAWKIRCIKGTRDLDDFISGFSSAFESLASTGAGRNTHGKGSGRIHEAFKDQNGAPKSLFSKSRTYNIAFNGTLVVTDEKTQHTGTVSFTGFIDGSHLGLHEGVCISTMTLEVSEFGKSDILYKVK